MSVGALWLLGETFEATTGLEGIDGGLQLIELLAAEEAELVELGQLLLRQIQFALLQVQLAQVFVGLSFLFISSGPPMGSLTLLSASFLLR